MNAVIVGFGLGLLEKDFGCLLADLFHLGDDTGEAAAVGDPLLVEASLGLGEAAGARAEFFINTATIGQPGYLTWGQVAEMHRAGMSFQSRSPGAIHHLVPYSLYTVGHGLFL